MRSVEFNKGQVIKYLAWTFGLAYAVQFGTARLYEVSGSIWVPALLHGAVNAAATLPQTLCKIDTGSARLLGPAPVGVLAGLPFLIAAAVLFFHGKEQTGADSAK